MPAFFSRSKTGLRLCLVAASAATVLAAAPVLIAQTTVRKVAPAVKLQSLLGGGTEIGVTIRDVTAAEVSREKLAGLAGAYVEEVRPEGPAAKAGLRSGDIVVSFDGERVRSARHLERLVDETPDTREVEVGVQRAGQRVALKVTPQSEPSVFERSITRPNLAIRPFVAPDTPMPYFGLNTGRLGVTVQELTDQLRDYFGAGTGGVLVTSVTRDTPAEMAGLKAGDVITKVNGQTVATSAELRRRLADAATEATIAVVRDRKEQSLTVKFRDARPATRTTV